MKPIAVVGSYLTGLTINVGRLPKPGETVAGSGYARVPGGKGSNQAIAVARLGGKADFVGCVGTDERGDDALELWKRERVRAEFVRRTGTYTGLGFVIVDGAGVNSIAIDPGANGDLSPEDVNRAGRAITGSGAVLLQLEIPHLTVQAAIGKARGCGTTVILNPAPSAEGGAIDLHGVDVVTPNEEEFRELTGGDDIDSGGRGLLSKGAKAVVVTLGSRGARVVTAKDSYSVPAPAVRVEDTTGAGDAFNGALAVALSEGEPLRAAVRFANYAGALCVTRPQVVAALPSREEVDGFLRSDDLE